MSSVCTLFKREFFGYFRSPVAYVVLVGFHGLATLLAFFVSRLLKGNEASLAAFFQWMPWLFVVLVPAAGMRLWAEERRAGTIELLFTLPVTTTSAVIAKFLAAWAFISIAVLLTLPFAFTVAYLGDPDWGIIWSSYVGSILMAASYLGICSLASALTRNQVVAFIIGLAVCLMLTFLGLNVVSDLMNTFLPYWVVDAVSNFSFYTHFESMTRGLIDLRAVVFFLSLAVITLLANVIVLEH
ncbi:ABC transporter permease subunit [Opitutales bacterium ASA1]|jgi:ABC-2 type transport system permease protein|uniref:ABC transporter permease n=1 Tax=Congregicoccus parvus TaxID=3081749 RepID=UPI002B27E9DE|nr:ABC transporter permease subunit [Opitutales bacterium ASA1]